MAKKRDKRSQSPILFDVNGRRGRVWPDAPPPDIAPLKPTAVYDTYWRFAVERQEIFFSRAAGEPPPWTEDKILAEFKFTNAYRAADRVSQYLIRSVIYRNDLPNSIEEVFFRTMLFKLFNKVETWELLESECGPITWSAFNFKRYASVLSKAMARAQRIYSAAYIMPSASTFGYAGKHSNHLALLEQMMLDGLPQKVARAGRMQDGFNLLVDYPSVGDFLAYQFITDINYTEITAFSENEFVVPGPGALDGIKKCFEDTGGLTPTEVIGFMQQRQDAEFRRLGITFRYLWGRPLQLIDCQNLFCEVGKYARQSHPDVKGVTDRMRIKQKFRPSNGRIRYWFPPKWGINEKIAGK
ncbi:MAG TPA: nucleotide kinase domain-containing protein [Gemmataceae bacterium]|nr:nucleotide kinase domain-containing protein [Gemmataceae bacterium]